VQTAEGELEIQVPQLRNTVEQFVSRVIPDTKTVIRTRPLEALIIGAYVRGLSDRGLPAEAALLGCVQDRGRTDGPGAQDPGRRWSSTLTRPWQASTRIGAPAAAARRPRRRAGPRVRHGHRERTSLAAYSIAWSVRMSTFRRPARLTISTTLPLPVHHGQPLQVGSVHQPRGRSQRPGRRGPAAGSSTRRGGQRCRARPRTAVRLRLRCRDRWACGHVPGRHRGPCQSRPLRARERCSVAAIVLTLNCRGDRRRDAKGDRGGGCERVLTLLPSGAPHASGQLAVTRARS
jgi:hypothetical protein